MTEKESEQKEVEMYANAQEMLAYHKEKVNFYELFLAAVAGEKKLKGKVETIPVYENKNNLLDYPINTQTITFFERNKLVSVQDLATYTLEKASKNTGVGKGTMLILKGILQSHNLPLK